MKPEHIRVAKAFSKQAISFDRLNSENILSQYLREQFQKEVLNHSKEGDSFLELNCGTGLDALCFAEKNRFVLATDISEGMIQQLENKKKNHPQGEKITGVVTSYHHLNKVQRQPFDYILSNFGGLNCTDKLKDVLMQFHSLLNKEGKVTLMIMPKICPWEILSVFKGNFKTAFRRFKKQTKATVEGQEFYCYYYNPSYVINVLKKDFDLLSLKGICITVPPEHKFKFINKNPRLFSLFKKIDHAVSSYFPFTYCCDHFLITLQKK